MPSWPTWLPAGALKRLLPNDEARNRVAGEAMEAPLSYVDAPAPSIQGWCVACRCAYLRLSEGYDLQAGETEALGLPVARLSGDHFSFVTTPDDVTSLLLGLSEQIA